MAAPDVSGYTDADKINVYLWDKDGEGKVKNIINQMGDAGKFINVVNIGSGGQDEQYISALNSALEKNASAYADVFLADEGVAKQWLESDKSLKIADLGITPEMYQDAYQYTIDYATWNGDLKGLSWQATPGVLVYRADIAKDVLGTDDPDEVSKKLASWDDFFTVAQQLKDKGYKIVSGTNDIKYPIVNQRTEPWVKVDGTNETLNLDSSLTTYAEHAKKLYDNDYTNQENQWGTPWQAAMADGNVFCYFGCTWFIGTMENNCGKDGKNFGQWRVAVPSNAYYWGGTYMGVGAETKNKELAAYFVYCMCCDTDKMYNLGKDTGDFVNNHTAVAKLIADGAGKRDFLGGQNPLKAFSDAADAIKVNSTYLDGFILGKIDDASTAYNKGELKSADECLKFVKDEVAKSYSYIAQ